VEKKNESKSAILALSFRRSSKTGFHALNDFALGFHALNDFALGVTKKNGLLDD